MERGDKLLVWLSALVLILALAISIGSCRASKDPDPVYIEIPSHKQLNEEQAPVEVTLPTRRQHVHIWTAKYKRQIQWAKYGPSEDGTKKVQIRGAVNQRVKAANKCVICGKEEE